MKRWNDLINYLYLGNQHKLDNSKYDNISLAFQKLIKLEIVKDTKNKKYFLDSINKSPKFIENFKKRIQNQVENLEKLGYENIFKNEEGKCLKTASRLVVGLGAGHVLETSLTLHHIFGIPYIPASALKGVVRMVSFWGIAENLNKKSDNEIEKLQEHLYDDEISGSDSEEILKHKLLFGTQNFKGLLVFLDAYPEIQDNKNNQNNNTNQKDEGIFELDVMTPHYQGYYTKNQVPGDWENPNPIIFLTVKKGITFCFNVLFDKYRAEEILRDDEFPKKVKEIIKEWIDNLSKLSVGAEETLRDDEFPKNVKKWLEAALTKFGIGAKTRLGYGIFD
jgi:CRISPR-associated protein Cmr6